ncbi:MAG: CinA family protein [Chloroflexi bacterium]|nr:MAG: competence protein ComA [Phototrophicales bacterium]RMF77945.1 MAG: CinA family protein [Chloroflexota bacterium]
MDNRLEAQVGVALLKHRWTIGCAESCTGGLVSHRITNIPGSSAYMMGGIVAYDYGIKQRVLGVQEATLVAYGAVSAETAGEMAQGALRVLDVDVAIAITGIAGPGGATPGKPVGLTYIGIATQTGILKVQRHIWEGDRETNKAQSADAALQLILDTLNEIE